MKEDGLFKDIDQLCWVSQPTLWAEFCKLTRRENLPSDLWTVRDVLEWFEDRLKKNIAGFIALAMHVQGTVH